MTTGRINQVAFRAIPCVQNSILHVRLLPCTAGYFTTVAAHASKKNMRPHPLCPSNQYDGIVFTHKNCSRHVRRSHALINSVASGSIHSAKSQRLPFPEQLLAKHIRSAKIMQQLPHANSKNKQAKIIPSPGSYFYPPNFQFSFRREKKYASEIQCTRQPAATFEHYQLTAVQ